jgi:ubiquinone/menaquinone biosynthesis C-methylase UbiE
MSVQSYYENPGLWAPERYLENPEEQIRFEACAALLPQDARSLLDVGTGNGAFLHFLEGRGRALELMGAERSETAIRSAVCRAPIRQASADALPFEDGAFDVVSALEVIEHFPWGVYERALGEIARVSGRYVLISVPYREKRAMIPCEYCGCACEYCGCAFSPDYHMRSFDEDVLRGLLPGFTAERLLPIAVYQDYLFGSAIRFVHATVTGRKRRAKPTAVCPQCGYSRSAATNGAAPRPQPSQAGSRLRRVLPPVRTVRWMAALYRKSA